MKETTSSAEVIAAGADNNFTECNAAELLAQIGRMNVFAISGGRVIARRTGITLPVGCGYSVTVDLAGNDTYTVRRIFTRAGVVKVKGELTDVYCDESRERPSLETRNDSRGLFRTLHK